MANTIISPNRYVQGRGELKNLPEHAKKLGKKLFVIISASGLKRVRDLLEKSFENTGMELVFEEFQGECCETEIKRLGSRFQENKCDLVVGVGGGKIHDSAKAAAYYQGAPVVIIPTIASTDAPCSALSVIYSETGVFERYLFISALFYPALTMLFLYRNTLLGLGNGVTPMLAGVCELLSRMIGAPVLGYFFGFTGLCWINPIAWVTASGLLFLSYRKTMRNIRPVDPTVDASDSNKIMN